MAATEKKNGWKFQAKHPAMKAAVSVLILPKTQRLPKTSEVLGSTFSFKEVEESNEFGLLL